LGYNRHFYARQSCRCTQVADAAFQPLPADGQFENFLPQYILSASVVKAERISSASVAVDMVLILAGPESICQEIFRFLAVQKPSNTLGGTIACH
jgi:hypothetical protein